MRIEVDNAEYEATPTNTVIFIGEKLINGIYTDLDPEPDYVMIPAVPTTGYVQLATQLFQEGVPAVRLDSYDPNADSYVHMIAGICRAFRHELDRLQVGDEA